MLWLMPSRKPFGFVSFLPFSISLFLPPSLYFQIIKLQSLFLLLPPFHQVLNILMFVIILFVHIFLMVLFLLHGYLQQTCLPISLLNHCLHLPLRVTVLFLVSFLYLNYFFPHVPSSCGGVLALEASQDDDSAPTWSSSLLIYLTFLISFVSRFFSFPLTDVSTYHSLPMFVAHLSVLARLFVSR